METKGTPVDRAVALLEEIARHAARTYGAIWRDIGVDATKVAGALRATATATSFRVDVENDGSVTFTFTGIDDLSRENADRMRAALDGVAQVLRDHVLRHRLPTESGIG